MYDLKWSWCKECRVSGLMHGLLLRWWLSYCVKLLSVRVLLSRTSGFYVANSLVDGVRVKGLKMCGIPAVFEVVMLKTVL